MDVLDFLHSESVQVMSDAEVGQYFLLLLHAWANEKETTLPDDAAYLARLARTTEVSTRVLARFEKVETDSGVRLRNRALYEEWIRVKKRSEEGRQNVGKRKDRRSTLEGTLYQEGQVASTHDHDHDHDHNHDHTNIEDQTLLSEPAGPDPSLRSALKQVWDYYISEIGKHPTIYTLTPLRLQMGRKRLAESIKKTGDPVKAVALMKLAVDALRDSEFHRGKNDAKKKYDDWEILFRSTEKFERWLEGAGQ